MSLIYGSNLDSENAREGGRKAQTFSQKLWKSCGKPDDFKCKSDEILEDTAVCTEFRQ